MQEQFREFLGSPSRETFLSARAALLESPNYKPYSDEFSQADELAAQERWTDAEQALFQTMPNLILSPRAHLYVSIFAKKRGDPQREELEAMLASNCAWGIISTGDGSASDPYLVLRISDEYDVLDALGKQLKTQALTSRGDRTCDMMVCTDESEVWFDISDPHARLEESLSL